jgi:hypothetical protein
MTRSGLAMQLSRLMIVAALLWHALLLAFAQMQSMPGGLLFLTLAGVMQSLTMVSHSVILLRASGQRFRGRIMGVRMLAIYSLPVGLLAAGALIERFGFRATATLYAVVGPDLHRADGSLLARAAVAAARPGGGPLKHSAECSQQAACYGRPTAVAGRAPGHRSWVSGTVSLASSPFGP